MARKKSGSKAKGRKAAPARGGAQKTRGRLGALAASFLFGEPLDEATTARVRELTGLAFIGFGLWLLLSMWTFHGPFDGAPGGANKGGRLGFYLANWAFIGIGLSGYLLALLGIAWGVIIVARKRVDLPAIRVLGAGCFVVSFAFVLDLAGGPSIAARQAWSAQYADAPLEVLADDLPYGPGGWLALIKNPDLVDRFGAPGLWVLLGTISLISFMLATQMAFYPAIVAFQDWAEERREERGESLGMALVGGLKRLALGIWDFLRGADLVEEPKRRKRAAARKKKPARAKSAAAKKASKKKAAVADDDLELEDSDDEEYEEEELDEEGAEEDEYEEVAAEDEEYEAEDEELEEDELEDELEEFAAEDEDEFEPEEDEFDEDELDELDELTLAPSGGGKKPRSNLRQTSFASPVYEPPTPPPGPWSLPSFELLEPPAAGGTLDKEFLEASARNLEHALGSFRVQAEVVGAQVGPAVTMFELTVAQGTRMNKVTQLSQEIAGALKARSVRIIAPIPGKSTIGIEVPNAKRRVVRISELVTQKAYDKEHMALPLFLGMDAEGKSIVEDLARMPHLLIAGTTGSGKSVCINTIIASLLLTRSPHDAKLILIDPKMVELDMFRSIPHLELPVVTDMKQATNVLLWAVEKMEGRYELFQTAGVKNIKTYNALGEEKLRERMGEEFNEERTPRHVPYIVLVIDEMADLMMQSKKEAEQAITRLAQKSRAVGIHVIVATQRPSTDVITGVIKANLPCRIAFQVASKIDSRVILDAMGAEKLLGQGDMLYNPPQSSSIRRVQGALVEDHELQALVDHVCKEAAPNFNQELVQTATGTAPPGTVSQGGDKIDEMFDEAVAVVLKYRRGSASLLQRALGIGYTRASRLIDQMTDHGIIGPHIGSKSREILMTLEDWEENKSNIDRAAEFE
ncbi:MAG: DNA translocase FtsK 4TM domain-containing protein [Planctomycetota bacterium]